MSKEAITGNVGEWSEVYVFFHILSTQRIFPCDASLNPYDYGYPVLEIIRIGKDEEEHFIFNEASLKWHKNEDSRGFDVEIDPEKCEVAARNFLEELRAAKKNGDKGAFRMPQCEAFLGSLGATKFKADPKRKTDIKLKISDARAGATPVCGFSIKSFLGKEPTLFNSTKGDDRNGRAGSSSFVYNVTLDGLNDEMVQELNTLSAELLVREIYKRGGNMTYIDDTIEGSIFRSNLRFIDACMPRMLAEIAVFYRKEDLKNIKEVTEAFASKDIFEFRSHMWYRYKMKKMLEASAFGMTAGTPWEGHEDANGGFIVVKPNGDVVTYHIYNRQELLDYLYQGTRFEHCSQSKDRNDYGYIYKDAPSNQWRMRLQIQIRYIKPRSVLSACPHGNKNTR